MSLARRPVSISKSDTNPTSPAPDVPARADGSRWLALYVLCAGMLMIVLDVTIVNVALPSIQEDLGFSPSDLAWVVNAFPLGGLLLLAGRIGAGLAALAAAIAVFVLREVRPPATAPEPVGEPDAIPEPEAAN